VEASAYFGIPANKLTESQWHIVFTLKGLYGKSNADSDGWEIIGEDD